MSTAGEIGSIELYNNVRACLTGYVAATPLTVRCNTTTASEKTEKTETRRT